MLPILIGEATKLTPYLIELDKEYVATVRLGVVTDTQDLSGAVLETRPVPALDAPAIEAALGAFVGVIRQVPPMYSALHHDGKRLYELAREGRTVAREAREVTVHAIALESVALPDFTLRVRCGKGTYIRTLAADLGAGARQRRRPRDARPNAGRALCARGRGRVGRGVRARVGQLALGSGLAAGLGAAIARAGAARCGPEPRLPPRAGRDGGVRARRLRARL